jgi:hypothetical protein
MRKSLVLAMVAVLACSSLALAGVPDPARSGCGTTGTGTNTCHYFFRVDGSADVLTCCVTLRDAFDTPVASCSTSVTITPSAGTVEFCKCLGGGAATFTSYRATAFSDVSGIIYFTCDNIGGQGDLDLAVTTHCAGAGNIEICTKTVPFTSTDLNASCESGSASTDVFDLGSFANGLPPGYDVKADYNCDGIVDVFDLGDFAGGLGIGCP